MLSTTWQDILLPHYPLEMFIRGTLTYLGLLLLLKIILKRQAGSLASSDMLVTVLIADAIQNGMAGEYKSVPDGLLLVSTIVAWDYAIDWISFRSKFISKLLTSAPVLLVKDGKLQRKNMRREIITESELWAKLRQEGVEALNQVKAVYVESEGEISVIKKHQG